MTRDHDPSPLCVALHYEIELVSLFCHTCLLQPWSVCVEVVDPNTGSRYSLGHLNPMINSFIKIVRVTKRTRHLTWTAVKCASRPSTLASGCVAERTCAVRISDLHGVAESAASQ